MKATKYFEVEGAVFRLQNDGPLEIYYGNGEYKAYTGDASRVYRLSNPMTLEEVKPYMDVEREK